MRNNHFGGTLHQASSRGVVPDAPCLREALPSPTAEDLRHVLAREAHSDPHHPILARPQKPGNDSEILRGVGDPSNRATTMLVLASNLLKWLHLGSPIHPVLPWGG